MTDTNKRIRELLTRYEGTGVTYAKAAHADAICALLPALLDENIALKAEVARLREDADSPEWLQERMEKLRKRGRINDPRQAAPEGE